MVTARYTILPYEGDFDESRAHQFAAEAEHSRPIVQHLGESAASELLPSAGTLLHLPELPVLTINLHTTPKGGALLTLFNASDGPQPASISSGLVQIRSATRCDLFGSPLEMLTVNNGVVEITIPQRQTFTLAIN